LPAVSRKPIKIDREKGEKGDATLFGDAVGWFDRFTTNGNN